MAHTDSTWYQLRLIVTKKITNSGIISSKDERLNAFSKIHVQFAGDAHGATSLIPICHLLRTPGM
jgi:hypothetical protein